MLSCSKCTREQTAFGQVKEVWKCAQDACINEQDMIDKINRRSLGFVLLSVQDHVPSYYDEIYVHLVRESKFTGRL